MNDELQRQIERSERDAITLDFVKWSAQRIQAKLPNDHHLWERERDDVLTRQRADNAEAGRSHRASLEAARAAKLREYDAEIDREFEPQKLMMRREWLANNPNRTSEDFDRLAWEHLRGNLIEQRNADTRNAELQAQMATGRYSL